MTAVDQVQRVPPLASDQGRFRRRALLYASGRAAICAFAQAAGAREGDMVLCPAYVGWSPREGSGVLDPLTSLGIQVEFYRVGSDLSPDLEDLSRRLKRSHPVGALIIHFFGHIDPTYPSAVRLLREFGAWVLEDNAHGLFTHLVTDGTGSLGDASVLSLHKLLPVRGGGALVVDATSEWARRLEGPDVPSEMLWDYDLAAIARRRRTNTAVLAEMLTALAGRADPLWMSLADADVLQTFPVILRNTDRDRVYELMNLRGYGVVSLYHTLVEGIAPVEYPESHALSRSILNLPVHQDLNSNHLADLATALGAVLDEVRAEEL